MTTTAAQGYLEAIKSAWETARGIEPALGKTNRSHVDAVRAAIDRVTRARDAGHAVLDPEDQADADGAFASLYARAAAVAVAAGDEATGYSWILEAEQRSKDDDQRGELAVARRKPERYRALVHGRNLCATGKDGAARSIWKRLVKGETDAIARAAKLELAAPRPVGDRMPTLWRWNGIGLGFYGSRDRESGEVPTYVTTHCLSLLWIPLVPVGAYRVAPSEGGYLVIAREQLSAFARIARIVVAAAIVLGIGGYAINRYLDDPDRLAGKRFDAALATAAGTDHPSLDELDAFLASPDLDRVGIDRAARAGAAVVRFTAHLVPAPFTATALDQATRVVRRFEALPPRARTGVARDAILAALDGWIAAVPADPPTQLVLLREALAVCEAAGDDRARPLVERIATTRLAVAQAMAADWPVDAFGILIEPPRDPASLAAARTILEGLADAPSLLDDAGADVDAWLALTAAIDADPLRDKVAEQRALGATVRAEAETEGVTPPQLAAMQKVRPWDQRAALALAGEDAHAGKLDAAAARLRAFGAPGRLIRDARFMLGQIAMAQDRLAEADALMSALLVSRVQRFVAAGVALEQATGAVNKRLETRLDTGDLPADLLAKLQSPSISKAEQNELISGWITQTMEADSNVAAARTVYLSLGDVVPVSLAAGTVKLRRAQGLAGAERDAMLAEAERTFLVIRTQAEGQPEFHLGLGEIYARLGKSEESEAEFADLLAKNDLELSLKIAHVYRSIGSAQRAKQVAIDVHAKASSPLRENAAVLLGLLTVVDDDESEAWFRKADQASPFVRTSLLEIEAGRLYRQGKYPECAAKYAEVARAYLSLAGAAESSGYNNAALAHQRRFLCTGDLAALREAETTLEKAYRAHQDDPIVVGNLASVLQSTGEVRALAKRIDVRALQLSSGDADGLLARLLRGPERDAILADLAADPGIRRSGDLYAQYEVLAPNSVVGYERLYDLAARKRDEVTAAAILDRVRRAKALDLEARLASRTAWRDGSSDQKYFAESATALARLDAVVARGKLDARTRAAALALAGQMRGALGLYQGDAAAIATGRGELLAAQKLWSALDTAAAAASSLIDEAGVAADGKAWIAERRVRSAEAALQRLADAGSPLAAAIRSSKQWGEVAALRRADATRPSLDDVRVARLLGDAGLETKARPVFDDKFVRWQIELGAVLWPGDPDTAEELAYFDKR